VNAQPHFDGRTYDPALDHDRLSKQLGRVYEVLKSHGWWTLQEIQWRCKKMGPYTKHDSEAWILARIRDLRKHKFGNYVVERKRLQICGLWAYRLLPKEPDAQGDLFV